MECHQQTVEAITATATEITSASITRICRITMWRRRAKYIDKQIALLWIRLYGYLDIFVRFLLFLFCCCMLAPFINSLPRTLVWLDSRIKCVPEYVYKSKCSTNSSFLLLLLLFCFVYVLFIYICFCHNAHTHTTMLVVWPFYCIHRTRNDK